MMIGLIKELKEQYWKQPNKRSKKESKKQGIIKARTVNLHKIKNNWLARLNTVFIAFLCSIVMDAQSQEIEGYVELHSHLMAEHTFGGSWWWGTADGPVDWALRRCDGNPTKSHAALDVPLVAEFIGSDTGLHLGKRRGYDRRRCKKIWGIVIPGTCPKEHFEHWPRHDGFAHQQMWHGYLEDAFDGGMKVMVVSFTESNFLCQNTPAGKRRYNCDEMDSVRRQIAHLNEFVDNHQNWVGIARSASEVRQLASQNKLALVLAVEISHLFPEGDFIPQLDEFYALGVRSLQIAHHTNNRFAGTSPIKRLIDSVNQIELVKGDITNIDDVQCAGGPCDGHNHLNPVGLSNEGAALVNALMDRGMLVDVSHTSRQTIKDVYDIAQQRHNYPLLYSHAHFFEPIDRSKESVNEKYIKPDEIQMIKSTGGMIGLRTGPQATISYSNDVANTCDGSVRSFAQSLMYAVDQGADIGFGMDLNGFIEQMKPRCSRDNFSATQDFQKRGLAHVGLLPQLMLDLSNVGVPDQYLDHLNQSAEKFVVMWENAESKKDLQGTASFDVSFNYSGEELDVFWGDVGGADYYVLSTESQECYRVISSNSPFYNRELKQEYLDWKIRIHAMKGNINNQCQGTKIASSNWLSYCDLNNC